MRKSNEMPVANVIFQILLEIMSILEILNGKKGPGLVGLAVRPGCTVVANAKEVQGLIFN